MKASTKGFLKTTLFVLKITLIACLKMLGGLFALFVSLIPAMLAAAADVEEEKEFRRSHKVMVRGFW